VLYINSCRWLDETVATIVTTFIAVDRLGETSLSSAIRVNSDMSLPGIFYALRITPEEPKRDRTFVTSNRIVVIGDREFPF